MLMLRARKNILVGDTRQLPPHTWKAMQEALHSPRTLTSAKPQLRRRRQRPIRSQISALGSTPQEREAADEETLFGHFTEHLSGTRMRRLCIPSTGCSRRIGELVSHCFYRRHRRTEPRPQKNPIDPRVHPHSRGTSVCGSWISRAFPEGRQEHACVSRKVDHIRRELRALQGATSKAVHRSPTDLSAWRRCHHARNAAQARRLTQTHRSHPVPGSERAYRDRRPLPRRRGPSSDPQHGGDHQGGIPENPEPDQRRDQPRPGTS